MKMAVPVKARGERKRADLPSSQRPRPAAVELHMSAGVNGNGHGNGLPMMKIARPNLLRRMNERIVFELVRQSGPSSRAELRRRMGVSAPTVSKAVAHLLRAGLLEEAGVTPLGGAGRPVIRYQVARGRARVLGATVGVRTCTVVVAGLDGAIDESATLRFDTPDTYADFINELARRARRLCGRKPVTSVLGIGISVPGEVDVTEGRVLLSPNLRILDGRAPARDLAARLKIPAALVHDAVASCLAEQQYGAAQQMRNFVRIGIYEGFGAAVVTGGRLLEGRRGLAGELGHLTVDPDGVLCGCGNRGCLETVATDGAFARAVSKRVGRKMQVEEVLRRAGAGELDVSEELARTLEFLAIGLAGAINLFNPEAILLTSRLLDAAPDTFARLRAMTAARALKPLADDCLILRVAPNAVQGAVAAIIRHLTHSLGPTVG